MKQHRFGSHTPEEPRRGSNLGHRVEGLLLAAVGVIALLDSPGFAAWASAISAILWPLVLLVAAAQLILYREPEGAFEAAGDHGRHGQPG
jgi:hypothetical protein